MAAEIRGALGLESRLQPGDPGEFTVWVDGEKIADKSWFSFPRPEAVVQSIRERMNPTPADEPEPTSRS